MGRPANPNRELGRKMLAEGSSLDDVAAACGVARRTVEQWAKLDAGEPQGVAPEEPRATKAAGGRSASRGGGGGRGTRPITEETGAMLMAGLFQIVCLCDGGDPVWPLSDQDARALGGPLADSLRVLPRPLADSINTGAAPFVFLSALTTVVIAKARHRGRHKTSTKPFGAAPTPVAAYPGARAPSGDPAPAPTPASNASDFAHAAAAVAAGKSTLSEAPDDMELAFGT